MYANIAGTNEWPTYNLPDVNTVVFNQTIDVTGTQTATKNLTLSPAAVVTSGN